MHLAIPRQPRPGAIRERHLRSERAVAVDEAVDQVDAPQRCRRDDVVDSRAASRQGLGRLRVLEPERGHQRGSVVVDSIDRCAEVQQRVDERDLDACLMRMSARHEHLHRGARMTVHVSEGVDLRPRLEKEPRNLDGVGRCPLPKAFVAVGSHIVQERRVVGPGRSSADEARALGNQASDGRLVPRHDRIGSRFELRYRGACLIERVDMPCEGRPTLEPVQPCQKQLGIVARLPSVSGIEQTSPLRLAGDRIHFAVDVPGEPPRWLGPRAPGGGTRGVHVGQTLDPRHRPVADPVDIAGPAGACEISGELLILLQTGERSERDGIRATQRHGYDLTTSGRDLTTRRSPNLPIWSVAGGVNAATTQTRHFGAGWPLGRWRRRLARRAGPTGGPVRSAAKRSPPARGRRRARLPADLRWHVPRGLGR